MSALTDNALIADIVTLALPAGFNLYFAFASIPLAFPFAVLLALGKKHRNPLLNRLSRGYIYAFRGSPLFISCS